MAAPPPDSDKLTAGLMLPPQLAVSPPPGPPGDQTLVASLKDSAQPQGTPVTPPPPISSPPPGSPVNWAQIASPTDILQRRSAQTPPDESNLPMGPVPPPVPAKKLTADGIPVAAESPADDPQPPETLPTPQDDQFSSWSLGLYDCRSDMDTCCLVFWCPCIAFGRMAEILDEGKSSCCCKGTLYSILHVLSIAAIVLGAPITFHFLISYKYRSKLKRRLNFPPNRREDFCTHFWCEGCALCQEYHELQTRGYHLSIGWHGNLEKQRQARMAPAMVSPPISPSMKR